jgi:hypothetical protein
LSFYQFHQLVNTLNLVTKLDSTGKTWIITGQVEIRAASEIQRNVRLHLYHMRTQ